ncbi:hypothetical protein BU23DRAFT_315524 [Bimuria novae-zelandiae CBS 107.79]|uniref:Secreted protein n=1 Tax=Bimuria novae-zelandiae CBS 107.79 TaxID=1447943 RepID=A0A6A5UUU8_9PLEO|nr:hypothetical protein BU23DRAFT_315524 [Bimuria novae-zelandiae CBS 107.79]
MRMVVLLRMPLHCLALTLNCMVSLRLYPKYSADPESRAPALTGDALHAVWCTTRHLRSNTDIFRILATLAAFAKRGPLL